MNFETVMLVQVDTAILASSFGSCLEVVLPGLTSLLDGGDST